MSRLPAEDPATVEVTSPGLPELLAALESLDGRARSEFSIDLHDSAWTPVTASDDDRVAALLVGGGEGGRVSVAHVVRDGEGGWDQDFVFLVEPFRGSQLEEHMFGGQGTTLPACAWVARDLAARAIGYLHESHGLDPSLRWATAGEMARAIE